MKFVIYKDYKSTAKHNPGWDYVAIEAADLEEAIEIADGMWEQEKDELYLMRIMKKVGKIERPYHAGYVFETYEAALCRRSYGWHRNVQENSESQHRVHKNWLTNNKNEVWYEAE